MADYMISLVKKVGNKNKFKLIKGFIAKVTKLRVQICNMRDRTICTQEGLRGCAGSVAKWTTVFLLNFLDH